MLYTKHTSVTTTDATTLWTMPSGYMAHIVFAFVANHGGSTNSVSLWYEDGGSPLVNIYDGTSLNSKNRLTLGNGGGPIFVLHAGETVKVQTSSAGDVDFAVTFDLLERPSSFVNFNGS